MLVFVRIPICRCSRKNELSYVSKVGMTDTDNQDRQWGLAALADGLNSLIPINEASGLAEMSVTTIYNIAMLTCQ